MLGHSLGSATGSRGRPRAYLHIGAMKTGTTYLQGRMDANREQLAEAGLLFPGPTWSRHDLAVREVMHAGEPGARDRGLWADLCQEMASYGGEASIVSMEFLSFADSGVAERVLGSFGGAEVHVILTVRDARLAVPSQWQNHCRVGGRTPLRQLVKGTRTVVEGLGPPTGRGARLFDRTQNIPRMVGTWAPLVGPQRFHVVTVPPRGSDPELLWRRFAHAVGVDPAVATNDPPRRHESLGHASAELIRRLNAQLGWMPRESYLNVVNRRLALDILGRRTHLEQPVRLHRAALGLLGRWNAQVARAITNSAVDVVGSLDDLDAGPPDPGAPERLPAPSTDELLAAATDACQGMRTVLGDLQAELAELQRPGDDRSRRGQAGVTTVGTDEEAPHAAPGDGDGDALDASLSRLAAMVREAIDIDQTLLAARR